MQKLLISLAIGFGAALIDTVPMFIGKLNPCFIVSAFLFWLGAGILISHVEILPLSWMNGALVATLMVCPLLPLIILQDRSALIQICLTTVALGVLSGIMADRLMWD